MTRGAAHRPLRILFVTNHRRFKITFRAKPWARELAARGHDVDVMCHADTERWRTTMDRNEGFRLIENPDLLVGALRQGWDPVCALRRRSFLFRENKDYDVIHCLDTRPAVVLPALSYARARGITIVSDWIDWWGRGGLITERRPWWYRLLFAWFEVFFEEHYRNRLDGLTAISHALIERAVQLGVPRERCLHIPGGADLGTFTHVPEREASKKRHGIAPDAPVLAFGGLDVLTDLPMAVRAYEIVRKTHPRVVLLLTGGATEKLVRSMVSEQSAMTGIKIVGLIPYADLPKHLSAADVFLMPLPNTVSNVGRWPNKIGDYMCIGRPTVSNPVGEVKWLFEQYEVGLLADETPESMADAVNVLLHDPQRAAAIGRRARHVAETVFDWGKLIVTLEDWYYDLLEERPGSREQPGQSRKSRRGFGADS